MANFVVSGTPHVRSKESIQSIMRDVIIALVPATAAGIYYFGLRALILIVAAIISAVFFEWLYEKITKKPVTINDLSAVVTGLLLAMNLPASAPVWVAIVGSAFAIIFAKQLFGGLGQNFINPALAGRAFLPHRNDHRGCSQRACSRCCYIRNTPGTAEKRRTGCFPEAAGNGSGWRYHR